MTSAITIKAFNGVPDGAVYPRTYGVGDRVDGELAAIAVAEGWAVASDAVPSPADARPHADAQDPAGDTQPPDSGAVRARLKKAYKGPDETGAECSIARNAVVEGALARMLVESGHAVEIAAAGGAPETA